MFNSPNVRRFNDTPFYIDPNCPKCNTPLVYEDIVELDITADDPDIFYDEFMCPQCKDNLCYMDWPPELYDEINRAVTDPLESYKLIDCETVEEAVNEFQKLEGEWGRAQFLIKELKGEENE